MLLIIEIALLIFGLKALYSGKFSAGKNEYVIGQRARRLGLICLAPFPTAFCMGMVLGLVVPHWINDPSNHLALVGIEFLIVIFCVVLLTVMTKVYLRQQKEEEQRDRDDDDMPYEDEDVHPRDSNNPYAAPGRD